MSSKGHKFPLAVLLGELSAQHRAAIVALLSKLQAGKKLSQKDVDKLGIDPAAASIKETARFFHVTERTVQNWMTKDMLPRNKDGSLDWFIVHQWLIEKQETRLTKRLSGAMPAAMVDKVSVDLAKTRAEVELKRLTIDEKRGELVRKDLMVSVMQRQAVALREFWTHAWRRDAPELTKILGVPMAGASVFLEKMDELIRKMMGEWISYRKDIDFDEQKEDERTEA